MKRESGRQLKIVRIFGWPVETIDGTAVTKKGCQKLLERQLGISDRQARAAVSSYRAEGWTLAPAGARLRLHDPFTLVTTARFEASDGHAQRLHAARVANGHKRWSGLSSVDCP